MPFTLYTIFIFLCGIWLVLATLLAAIRTFILPRGEHVLLTRVVSVVVYQFFRLRLRFTRSYAERDRVLALLPAVTLLTMPIVWMTLVTWGFTAMFWAVGERPLSAAFLLSGSSLLTLGFAPVSSLAETLLAFAAATIGLGLVAVLIAYLPTMYTAFSNREKMVTLLDVRAGRPPSPIEMIERFQRLDRLEKLGEHWNSWETWFGELEESHTSFNTLVFFRSQRLETSWVSAAGTVLDTAALSISALAIPRDVNADLCIRAGYLALRSIADTFGIEYDPEPQPGDPISVSQAEFSAACERLAAAGVPLVADREQAWRDWAGWRVNYDQVLVALSELVEAPLSPWLWNGEHSALRYRRRGPQLRGPRRR